MTLNEELTIVLEEELKLLRSLNDITYKKTDIIIGNEIDKLEEITKQEENLINKIALKEKEREELLYSWGLKKDTSISEIIEKTPEGKEKLNTLKGELINLLKDIQSRNLINNELIQENLEWLDFNMNLIYNTQTPPTYGDNEKTRKGNSLFDRKV